MGHKTDPQDRHEAVMPWTGSRVTWRSADADEREMVVEIIAETAGFLRSNTEGAEQ